MASEQELEVQLSTKQEQRDRLRQKLKNISKRTNHLNAEEQGLEPVSDNAFLWRDAKTIHDDQVQVPAPRSFILPRSYQVCNDDLDDEDAKIDLGAARREDFSPTSSGVRALSKFQTERLGLHEKTEDGSSRPVNDTTTVGNELKKRSVSFNPASIVATERSEGSKMEADRKVLASLAKTVSKMNLAKSKNLHMPTSPMTPDGNDHQKQNFGSSGRYSRVKTRADSSRGLIGTSSCNHKLIPSLSAIGGGSSQSKSEKRGDSRNSGMLRASTKLGNPTKFLKMMKTVRATTATRKAGVFEFECSLGEAMTMLQDLLVGEFQAEMVFERELEVGYDVPVHSGSQPFTIHATIYGESKGKGSRVWIRRSTMKGKKGTLHEFDWFCSELYEYLVRQHPVKRPHY